MAESLYGEGAVDVRGLFSDDLTHQRTHVREISFCAERTRDVKLLLGYLLSAIRAYWRATHLSTGLGRRGSLTALPHHRTQAQISRIVPTI